MLHLYNSVLHLQTIYVIVDEHTEQLEIFQNF